MKINASRRRAALGSDPLDALVPDTPAESSREEGKVKARGIRATFHLPVELFDLTPDAAYWTPGPTLSGLCEASVRSEIAHLEHKRGEPFPKRATDLKLSRPVP